MEIYLIRHTRPAVADGICYGQTDLLVADSFSVEWKALQDRLPSEFDAVISSPLKRCVQLAKMLKTADYQEDKRLMELNFGLWEMKKWNDIEPDVLQRWMDDFVRTATPEGESFGDLSARVMSFGEELFARSAQKVAIVAHGGSIRTLLSNILGLSLDQAFNFDLDYGKVSLITTFDKTKKVKYINA